jgi:hypothetical protein
MSYGALAASAAAQDADDLAGPYLQVDVVEHETAVEGLGQAADAYDGSVRGRGRLRLRGPERAVSAVVYAGPSSYLDLLVQTLVQRGIHVSRVTIVGAVGPYASRTPR